MADGVRFVKREGTQHPVTFRGAVYACEISAELSERRFIPVPGPLSLFFQRSCTRGPLPFSSMNSRATPVNLPNIVIRLIRKASTEAIATRAYRLFSGACPTLRALCAAAGFVRRTPG
jgi:hypothetical protein